MSFAIQLPTMASNKEQVGACVNMLSEKLPEGQERGLQALIFLGQYMEDWEGTKEEVRKSFSLIPPDFEITVHAPFTLTHLNPFFDLRDGRSICAVGQVADFVSDLGVKNITLHTGSTVMLKDWDGHYADPSVKSEERKRILDNMYEIGKRNPQVNFGLENLTLPLGDEEKGLDDIGFDWFMVEPKDILRFGQELAQAGPNLGLCLDLDHYFLTRSKLASLWASYKERFNESDMRESCVRGLSLPLVRPGSAVDFVRELNGAGVKIFDCQVSGHEGRYWIPSRQISSENSVLNDKNEGKQIMTAVGEISRLYPSCRFSLDVDVKDYIAREEQRESLDYFLGNI